MTTSAVAPLITPSTAAQYINAPNIKQIVIDYSQLFALYLQKPFHWATQPILRSIGTRIRPGKGDNCNFYVLEVTRRVFAFTFGCIVGTVSVPLLIPSLIIDRITQYCQDTDFTHWRGNASEKTEISTLKFMTFNACSLWGGLPYLYGGCRPPTERTSEIAKKILEQDPDVVAFQEMSFDPSHSLYHALKDRYAHFITRIGPNVPMMESGLCVVSKYPILDADFIPFPNQFEYRRGAFRIETKEFNFVLTHLTQGHGPKEKKERKAQLQLIREKMEIFDKEKPCYLLGDLNIDRCDHEYRKQIARYFNDLSTTEFPENSEENSTCTESLSRAITRSFRPEKIWEYIDYPLTLKSRKIDGQLDHIETYDSDYPDRALSDHKMVILQLNKIE